MHGWIDNKIYKKYEKESEKLRIAGGSWTISLQEIYGKVVEQVAYQTEKALYYIMFSKAQEKGFIRVFKGEPKLVVPIEYWSIKNLQ